MPMISIITVCYNDIESLTRTIESIKKQSITYQHIIIDGGSSDGTVELINSGYSQENNLVFISEPDNGVYDAINKGIKKASYEYIIILNAGDTFSDNNVIKQIFSSKYFNDQYYLIGRVNYVYSNGQIKNDKPNFPTIHNIECSHQAFIYKKTLHDELGYYSLDYKSASDYDFFSKVFKKVGLLQNTKLPVTVAIREKFGGDMSDSLSHTIEMIKIDYKNDFLKYTFFRRFVEVVVKLIKYLKSK